jgi:hypothetical protein
LIEILSFMGANPWLTWGLAWGIWPVSWAVSAVLTTPFNLAFKAYNRSLRARNIALHGWPSNPLMDADGDIVHPPVEKTT